VWLDDVPSAQKAEAAGEGEDAMPQREAYALADIHLIMSSPEVGTEAAAVGIAIQALGAVQQMVDGDPQLSGKKGFYVKMGCRGDWPVLQPPGWDGTWEGMSDPATGKPYREMEGGDPRTRGPQPAAE
jgi:hypothetical protein